MTLAACLTFLTIKGYPLSFEIDVGFENHPFNYVYNEGKMTEDQMYAIPDHTLSTQYTSCSFKSTSETFTGTKSFQEDLSVFASVSGGASGLVVSAGFSASTEFRQMS